MKKPIQIGLKWLLVLCIAAGALIGYVGMQVRRFDDVRREGGKIEDYVALHAKPGTYRVLWYDCDVQIRDPQFGDKELHGLKPYLSRFPGRIWLDVRGTSITRQGLLSLRDAGNIAQLKVCTNSLAHEDTAAMKELLGIEFLEITDYDPKKTDLLDY